MEINHKLQLKLQDLVHKNDLLKQQISVKDKRIQHLEEQLPLLQAKIRQPSYTLATQSKPYEPKLYELEEKVSQLIIQVSFLDQTNKGKQFIINKLQSEVLMLQTTIIEKDNQIDNLKIQVQDWKGRLEHQKTNCNKMSKIVEESSKETRIHLNKISELQKTIKEKKIEREYKVIQIGKDIAKYSQFLESFSKSEADKMEPEQISSQSEVVLNLREQVEILNRSVCRGSPYTRQQQFLQNTIKHLKNEISKYNKAIRELAEKYVKAETTIKEYNEISQKYNTEYKNIEGLKNQNTSLKEKLSDSTMEIANLKNSYEQEVATHKKTKIILLDFMKENQCYYEFMYGKFEQSYSYQIEKHKIEFEKRLQDRVNKEKWATIEELVNVNEKLRKRIREYESRKGN